MMKLDSPGKRIQTIELLLGTVVGSVFATCEDKDKGRTRFVVGVHDCAEN